MKKLFKSFLILSAIAMAIPCFAHTPNSSVRVRFIRALWYGRLCIRPFSIRIVSTNGLPDKVSIDGHIYFLFHLVILRSHLTFRGDSPTALENKRTGRDLFHKTDHHGAV